MDSLKVIFTLTLALFLINVEVNCQNEYNVITNEWLQYSDAPNSLYHHIAGQAYDLLAQRAGRISKLSSLAYWQKRQ